MADVADLSHHLAAGFRSIFPLRQVVEVAVSGIVGHSHFNITCSTSILI